MIYVNYPFLTGMPAVLWETRWGWSKALPLTFPPAGAAECWTWLPKVTGSYSEVREISAAPLEKHIHSYGARWLGTAREMPAHVYECLCPCKFLLPAYRRRAEWMRAEQDTRGKSFRTSFCPICYCSWHCSTNGSGHLAEKWRHWWHVRWALAHRLFCRWYHSPASWLPLAPSSQINAHEPEIKLWLLS